MSRSWCSDGRVGLGEPADVLECVTRIPG